MMDCVGLTNAASGETATAGYGAALKVLFEFDNAEKWHGQIQLKRTELRRTVQHPARIRIL